VKNSPGIARANPQFCPALLLLAPNPQGRLAYSRQTRVWNDQKKDMEHCCSDVPMPCYYLFLELSQNSLSALRATFWKSWDAVGCHAAMNAAWDNLMPK